MSCTCASKEKIVVYVKSVRACVRWQGWLLSDRDGGEQMVSQYPSSFGVHAV